MLRSADAGRSWEPVDVDADGRLYDVDFVGARGVAVGYGVILRSDDGGRAWEPVALPADRWLASVSLVTEDVGFAAGGHDSEPVLWRTGDGGRTWRDVADRLPRDGRAALRHVEFVHAERGFVLGAGGLLCETTDGGERWTRVETGSDAWLRGIDAQGDELWIAASPGLLCRASADASFEPVPDFAERKLTDVRFTGAERGFVTAFDGEVLATADGGATWTAELVLPGTPTTFALRDGSELFVASDAGVFRRIVERAR